MSVALLGQFDPQFMRYMNEVMAAYRKVFRSQNHWALLANGTAGAGFQARAEVP
jgi:aspartate aminotransferase-like enzyme